jgi:hypothetical protein
MADLDPGTIGRRWLPDGGERKLREKIHKESTIADTHKNLPFKFSKPRKSSRESLIKCVECGNVSNGSVNTVMVICRNCKKVTKVKPLE